MLIDKKAQIMRTGFLIILLSLISVSCSSAGNDKKSGDDKQVKGKQTLVFFSGDQNDKYEAVFSKGELISLSKNGKQLSKEEMKENEDLVNENLDAIRGDHEGDGHEYVFRFDDKIFGKHMEHFGEKMKLMKPFIMKELDSIRVNFDTAEFNANMRALGDNLAGLKKMKIHVFDDMDMDFDIPDIEFDEKDFNIDMDKVNKDLEKASEEIKRSAETIKKLDFPKISETVKESMRRASIDLKKSKKTLKKLNEFLHEMKQEMVKDNLIKNTNDEIKLKITDGDIYVNGKKLPEDLQKKYKKMYREKFGHNWDGNFFFNLNDN